MTSNFKSKNFLQAAFISLLISLSCFSQGDTSTFKAQFALGVNNPSSNGFVNNFEAKSINLPSVNLGLQYMFKPRLGAKIDYGFNRFSNVDNTPEFKINYSRINLQFIFDASKLIHFSNRIASFIHVGPGVSIIKPLRGFRENKISYLNAMSGVEIHYGISNTLSIYLDGSYIYSFSKDFNPISTGIGSFNGDLLTITFGVSISLSGCYYCRD